MWWFHGLITAKEERPPSIHPSMVDQMNTLLSFLTWSCTAENERHNHREHHRQIWTQYRAEGIRHMRVHAGWFCWYKIPEQSQLTHRASKVMTVSRKETPRPNLGAGYKGSIALWNLSDCTPLICGLSWLSVILELKISLQKYEDRCSLWEKLSGGTESCGWKFRVSEWSCAWGGRRIWTGGWRGWLEWCDRLRALAAPH